MNRVLLTGNAAAAWGARLARAEYFPAFPITPQTEIVETLAGWIEGGAMSGRLTMLESEHSMVTAAAAAAATGVRTFTATSSQGLLHAMEMLYAVSGWRAPFVLVNVSRALATPITLESDHNDVLAARDSGFLQIHCATCQEVLDSILIAYRVAEDSRVRLPALVNMDGFTLSFTREPVEVPESGQVNQYLKEFRIENTGFRASQPVSRAVAVIGGVPYSYFRYEAHLAANEALRAHEEAARDFARTFGRSYGALECYRSDDAEVVFFLAGAFATKAHDAVDRLREAGFAAGLVRPRLVRPWPAAALREALAGKKGVAVIDQNLSIGRGGVLHTELAATLYGAKGAPPVLASFIGGLGGRDIGAEELYEIARVTREAAREGRTPEPRLLYTARELREVRKLQAIAAAERTGLGGAE